MKVWYQRFMHSTTTTSRPASIMTKNTISNLAFNIPDFAAQMYTTIHNKLKERFTKQLKSYEIVF